MMNDITIDKKQFRVGEKHSKTERNGIEDEVEKRVEEIRQNVDDVSIVWRCIDNYS
jgi:hypothetical protein